MFHRKSQNSPQVSREHFPFQSEDCTGDECPAVDCKVSDWADWSECQVSCLSKGMEEELVYQTRQRDIIVQPDKR